MLSNIKSGSTTARPEHPNTNEAEKNNFIKMIKVLKKEMEKSLKEVEEKTNKKLEEINKSLKENQGSWAVVVHVFKPSTWKAEAGGSL